MLIPSLTFWRMAKKCFFDCAILHSNQHCMEVPSFTHPCQHLLLFILLITAILKFVVSLLLLFSCWVIYDFVHVILQARILEWFAISFSRASSWSSDQTHVSCLAGKFFTTESPGKPDVVSHCDFNLFFSNDK